MRWIAILITIFHVGCAAHIPDIKAHYSPENTQHLLEQTHITASDAGSEKTADLLAISPEMREFIDSIDPTLHPSRRFRKILRTLKLDGFQLEYDLNRTTNAAEAFAERRGNCISFAALIVALARDVGLEASFNRVDAPLGRAKIRNANGRQVIQNILHINAEVSYGWSSQVIEINFKPRSQFPHIPLEDEEVASMYLNNLALEASNNGDLPLAFSLIHNALTLHQQSAMTWTTLGYLYRQRGTLDLAEMSYNQALYLDGDNSSAQANLRNIYQLRDQGVLSSRNYGAKNAAPEA
ncbi:transglutaminase domain-containing protein [Microbulbifer aggregans]|uniref:transglutaminase domain-containing protein n=1 Tax=Microbulbifer aggregans TaxID=1769779 RepID=UPI001CFE977B|nr:transglutaminase domain-containing protein [Microbulbifer aggregans]